MRNAALILGVIGGAIGNGGRLLRLGRRGAGREKGRLFRVVQELGARRVVDAPLIGKLFVLAAPMAGIPAAALRRAARPSPASSWSFRPSASSGASTSLFTMFPIAMSAVAGPLALGGALTLPVQPSH